jgi:anti-sigma B factor antagonist
MWVLIGQRFASIKISGRANFHSSVDFKTLLSELCAKGYAWFVLDLSECLLMDSTFLGVLAGFGLKIKLMEAPDDCQGIELLNPNPRIVDLLENLGVLHLFKVSQGLNPQPQSEAAPVASVGATKEDFTRACLEAHQTLMDINPQNVERFKDIAKFLAEDLKKLKSASPRE